MTESTSEQGEALWFYMYQNQRVGPVPIGHIRYHVSMNQLGLGDLVFPPGAADWVRLATVAELRPQRIKPAPYCPRCRAPEFDTTRSKALISFAADRVCKRCGTRYRQPTPMWASLLMIALGTLLLLAGIGILLLLAPRGMDGRPGSSSFCSYFWLAGFSVVGIGSLVAGLMSLRDRASVRHLEQLHTMSTDLPSDRVR